MFFKYYKLLMKNGAQWVNVTIIYHHATIIQWDLEYYLFLTMSSQPLIEEVGNLINSSIDWVPQAIQDHPNHLLFQIYWTKMRGEEKPWLSRIFLQEQSPQSCRRQRAWRPSLLHLETWIMVMVMMMNSNSQVKDLLMTKMMNLAWTPNKLKEDDNDNNDNAFILDRPNDKDNDNNDHILDRPNQLNGQHQLHEANCTTAVSV